jgi:hypothetical protein
LRTPIELNELKPETDAPPGTDLISHWRSLSADGEGREVMAAMLTLLETTPAAVPRGADIENNRLFVWPGLSETSIAALSPIQDVELLQLSSATAVSEMKQSGRYKGWRLTIGADGTWHAFQKVQ